MPQIGHMNANLMGAPRFQTKPHMGKARITCQHLIMGDGGTGVLLRHRHFLPLYGMPPNRRVYRAAVLAQGTIDHRFIGTRKYGL